MNKIYETIYNNDLDLLLNNIYTIRKLNHFNLFIKKLLKK